MSATPRRPALTAAFAALLAHYRALNRNARLYLLYNVIQAVSVGAAYILYTLFLNALGYSNTFISQAIVAGTLGGALGILPAGLLLDRLGWRAMLLWSNVGGGAALLLQFFVPTAPVILGTSAVVGVSVAMVLVVNGPLLAANSGSAERTALFGLSNAASFLASVAGTLLGGFLPEWLGRPAVHGSALVVALRPFLLPDAAARDLQLALVIAGALAVPSLIPVLLLREERGGRGSGGGAVPWRDEARARLGLWRREWRERLGALRATLRAEARGPVGRFSASQALLGIGAGIFVPYVNIYFVRGLHATTGYFGTLTSTLTILMAAAALLSAPLAARFGKLRMAVVAQLASLPFLLMLGAIPTLLVASAAYLLRGTCMNLASPAVQASYMEAVPAGRRGFASSVYNGTYQGAIALGSLIGGPLSDAGGYRWTFFLAAPLYAASTLLLALWFGRARRRSVDDAEDAEERRKLFEAK